MQRRAPVVLSVAALVIAVLGTTPLGNAAGERLAAVVPFAKTSGFARTAGNAARLNGRRSTLSGVPGTIPVLGRDGKLPAAVGAVGPQGARGPQGERGPQGPAGAAAGSARIGPSSVGSAEVIDNSLTGADVNESTLAQVPSALTTAVGGLGVLTSAYPSSGATRCTPPSTNAFDACAQIVVNLPARSRVLLLGRISGRPTQAGNTSAQYATCRIGRTGAAPAGPSVQLVAYKDEAQAQGTLIGLSPPLGPGRETFTIDCAQGLQGVRGFQFYDAALAAVALSPS